MDHQYDARQLERLTFFSDAVFAIAMTLLVIEVRLPELHTWSEAVLTQVLIGLFGKYFAFVLSFLVIGRFWVAHHRIFGLLARTSDRLIGVNLIVLLCIAFMPFPTAVLSELGALKTAVLFYGAWLTVIGLAQRALVVVALKRRDLVRADVPDEECRFLLRGSWIAAVIGVLTIVTASFSSRLGLAVLVFGSPVVFRLLHRRSPPAAGSDGSDGAGVEVSAASGR